MEVVKTLETLDLSRNGITTIPPGTFRDLSSLKYLDLSLNSLRTVSDSFELNILDESCFYTLNVKSDSVRHSPTVLSNRMLK